jgi:hypothetical protein
VAGAEGLGKRPDLPPVMSHFHRANFGDLAGMTLVRVGLQVHSWVQRGEVVVVVVAMLVQAHVEGVKQKRLHGQHLLVRK